MSCRALVVSENLGNDLPVAGNLPLTETGLPPKVTVAPDFFFATFFAVFLAVFFFVTFLAVFFSVFFFVAIFFYLIFLIS